MHMDVHGAWMLHWSRVLGVWQQSVRHPKEGCQLDGRECQFFYERIALYERHGHRFQRAAGRCLCNFEDVKVMQALQLHSTTGAIIM